MAAHVSDRIERGDDPEPRGHQREEHAERFHLEGERQPGEHLHDIEHRPAPRPDHGQDFRGDQDEQGGGGGETDGLSQIGTSPQEQHQDPPEEGPDDGQTDSG